MPNIFDLTVSGFEDKHAIPQEVIKFLQEVETDRVNKGLIMPTVSFVRHLGIQFMPQGATLTSLGKAEGFRKSVIDGYNSLSALDQHW